MPSPLASLHLIPTFSTFRYLVHIHKVGILLVGEITKGRLILSEARGGISIDASSLQSFTLVLLALVLVDERVAEDKEEAKLNDVADQQRANTQSILGCLVGVVEEGAGDGPDTGAEPDDARDSHLLGLAAGVAGDEGEADEKGGLVGAGEVATGCQYA